MPRRTLWLDDTTSVTVADGATSILNPTATYVDDKKGLTITRIIVSFQCRAASEVGGALGFQRVSMGLGMASDDAIEQGSAALPDPAVEAEFPVSGWLFRGTKLIILGVDPSVANWVTWELDLRAQRKLLYGDLFLRHGSTNVAGGAFSYRANVLTRVLVKLP